MRKIWNKKNPFLIFSDDSSNDSISYKSGISPAVKKVFVLFHTFIFLLNFNFVGHSATASPRSTSLPHAQSESLCLKPQLARLKDSTHCAIEYRLSGNQFLCLSKNNLQFLLQNKQSPFSCQPWKGVWKTSTNLKNLENTQKENKLYFQIHSVSHFDSSLTLWGSVLFWIEKKRLTLSQVLESSDKTGIIRKLLINESPQTDLGLLSKFGFVHVLTAAGIHIYFIFEIISFIFLKLFRRHSFFAHFFSFGVVSFSWLLQGARPGLLRPLIIVSLKTTSRFLGFRWQYWLPFFISLSLDVLTETYFYFTDDKTLSLSFSQGRVIYSLAVAGGMLLLENKSHFKLCFYSWILTAIYEVFTHHWISLSTPLLSYFTLGLFCFLIYPLGIFYSLVSHPWLEWILKMLTETVHWFVDFLTSLVTFFPFFWMVKSQFLFLAFFLTLIFYFIYLVFFRKNKFYFFITVLLFFGISHTVSHIFDRPSLEPLVAHSLQQLDVGQGDAALIRFQDLKGRTQFGMIDTGSKWALKPSQWLDFFLENEVNQLNFIILTHADEDHTGGLEHLQKIIPIHHLILPPDSSRLTHLNLSTEIQTLSGLNAAEYLKDYSIEFKKFSQKSFRKKQKPNSLMTGVAVNLQNKCIYLNSGDLHYPLELKSLDFFKSAQKNFLCSIFKLNHHGSKTSNSFVMIKKLNPTAVWNSSGAQNQFGHPSYEVLERLTKLHIPLYRTDQEGLLTSETVIKEVFPHQ